MMGRLSVETYHPFNDCIVQSAFPEAACVWVRARSRTWAVVSRFVRSLSVRWGDGRGVRVRVRVALPVSRSSAWTKSESDRSQPIGRGAVSVMSLPDTRGATPPFSGLPGCHRVGSRHGTASALPVRHRYGPQGGGLQPIAKTHHGAARPTSVVFPSTGLDPFILGLSLFVSVIATISEFYSV
jgi:hypothetical protein